MPAHPRPKLILAMYRVLYTNGNHENGNYADVGFPEEGGREYLITVLGVRLQDIGAKLLRGRGRSQGVRRRSSERFYGLVKEGRGVELLSILGAWGEGAKRSRSTEAGFREILRVGLRVYIARG